MKRRDFIKLSASASAIGLLPTELKAMLPNLNLDDCDFTNRKLILINLAGGNDGLNTIVPLDQYAAYANLRPDIKVPETGLNQYINLDTTLADNQLIGLNPALTGFKSMYDNGTMRVIQSVGYPSQNKSHFASNDLYMTGNDGNSWGNGQNSGWMGRFMEKHYEDLLEDDYPLAIQIGSAKSSLGFHGIVEHGMSINLTGQDASGFYSVISGFSGQTLTSFPNSDYGTELNYIVNTDQLANQYAASISDSFNTGNNDVTYPNTDIANQFKTVARLISGGLESKIYMVRLGGFDTHNNLVEAGEDIEGRHYTLLQKLDEAVTAFFTDLENQNLADDVVGITYSEFGRKAKQNGNQGTDHGEIAPMFLFGKPVNPGVSGTNPDLSEAVADNNYQIETVQFDYRQTFATLLQQFLGGKDETIDDTFLDHTNNTSFISNFQNDLIKETYKVPISCLVDEVIDNNVSLQEENKISHFQLYPNPCVNLLNVIPIYDFNQPFQLSIYNLNGQKVFSQFYKSEDDLGPIAVDQFDAGVYQVYILSEKHQETHRIVKM